MLEEQQATYKEALEINDNKANQFRCFLITYKLKYF